MVAARFLIDQGTGRALRAIEQRDLLAALLWKFVDQYAYERHTWPDDMVALLDEAHGVLSEVMGQERKDT